MRGTILARPTFTVFADLFLQYTVHYGTSKKKEKYCDLKALCHCSSKLAVTTGTRFCLSFGCGTKQGSDGINGGDVKAKKKKGISKAGPSCHHCCRVQGKLSHLHRLCCLPRNASNNQLFLSNIR